MKKFNIRVGALALLIAILWAYSRPVLVEASNNSITIDISKAEADDFTKEGRSFDIWYIGEGQLTDEEKVKLAKDLSEMTREELDRDFNGHLVSEKTGKDGQVLLSGLEEGTYYGREHLEDPLKEKERIAPFVFSVPSENDTIFPKPLLPPPSLDLKKVDENGMPLKGAEFELYRLVDGEEVRVGLTDFKFDESSQDNKIIIENMDGQVFLYDLPVGAYLLREVKAPEGYKISQADIYFSIEEGKTTELSVVNIGINPPNENRFLKYDGETNLPIPGAIFKIMTYNEETKTYADVLRNGEIYTVESDSEGKFVVDGLPYGTYYLWEIRPPKGYTPLASAIKFELAKIHPWIGQIFLTSKAQAGHLRTRQRSLQTNHLVVHQKIRQESHLKTHQKTHQASRLRTHQPAHLVHQVVHRRGLLIGRQTYQTQAISL